MILTPTSLSVAPGEVAAVQIRVRNTSDVVEQYALSVVGEAASWSVLEPPELRIFPGQEATSVLRLQPPRDATATAGPVAFGLRATPANDPSSSVVEEGELEVGAFSSITADLSPRNVEGQSASHMVRIRNAGNAPTEVGISVVDPDERTVHRISSPQVAVPAGAEAAATVKVTTRAGKGRAPRRLGYQVVVTPAGQPPIPLDASLTVSARRRKAPLVALAILLGVVLIAFLALRPKVQSATTEIKQIRNEVAAAQKAVEQAKEQVDEAKKAATEAKEEVDEAGQAVDSAGDTVEEVTGSTVTTARSTVAAGGTGTEPALTGGSTTTAAPTTTVATGVLTGEKAFGTTQPQATCLGGGASGGSAGSSAGGQSSTTSTTRP